MDLSESGFSMQTLFQERLANLWQTHGIITDYRVLTTHYKEYFKENNKSYIAKAYELTLCNTLTNKNRKQIIYTKQYQQGYSQNVFSKLLSENPQPAPLHLKDIGMIAWRFPSDPTLPHLAEAIEPDKVKKHLSSQASNDLNDLSVSVEIVNYRPEIRCTAWYELHNSNTGQSLTLFGKIYADDRYKRIYERLQWLQQHLDQRTFLIAPLAGYSEAIKTFWQEKIDGQPLLEVINHTNYKALLDQAAQRLTTFNQCSVPCPAKETNQDQLKEVTKKIKKLKRVFPHLQERFIRLQQDLEEQLPQLTAVSPLVVHSDFHIRQMLLHKEQVVLFDFDECRLGDPIEDLAHFIADLYTYSFDTSLIENMSRSFLESYSNYSHYPIPVDRLGWHLQIQFINRAYRNYLQQKPDLNKQAEVCITLAEKARQEELEVSL